MSIGAINPFIQGKRIQGPQELQGPKEAGSIAPPPPKPLVLAQPPEQANPLENKRKAVGGLDITT